jgi:hypothetical protein
MPTQVQGLITPTYDAVIEVLSNGEVCTEAALTNTAVALGNRIEFVRRLSANASADPETSFYVREDWSSAVYVPGSNLVHGDVTWSSAIGTGTPTGTYGDGSAKNPGNFIIGLPAGATADQLSVALGSMTSDSMTFASFQRIVHVFKVVDNAGNPSTQFQFGLSQNAANLAVGAGGTDSLRIRYSKADSANWLVNFRKSSVGAQFDSGVPFVSGEYIVASFERNVAAGVDVSINGSIVHTVNAADLPLGSGALGFEAFKSGADVFACSLHSDFIFGLQFVADRSGA